MSGAIVEGTTAWYLESRDQVLLLAETFGLAQAISPEQRRLLGTALAGLRSQIGEHPFLPFIHLPLLVYAGLRGDDKPARPLAVVTCLLFLGFDILDDLADGDLAGRWDGYRPAEIKFVATGLLSTISLLALT